MDKKNWLGEDDGARNWQSNLRKGEGNDWWSISPKGMSKSMENAML